MSFNSLMWGFADLYRSTVSGTVDTFGGFTETFALVNSNIPCNLQLLSGDEQYVYGKNNIVATHILFTNTDVVVRTDDKFLIADKYYDIIMIDPIFHKHLHHLEIYLKEVDAPDIFIPESSSSNRSSSSSSEGNSSSSSSSSDSSSSSSEDD